MTMIVVSHKKDNGNAVLSYSLDMVRILRELNPDIPTEKVDWTFMARFVEEADESLVNRGGNRWQALVGVEDGTDWFIKALRESAVKVIGEDRKKCTPDLLTKLAKAKPEALALFGKANGFDGPADTTADGLARQFAVVRVKAREAKERADAAQAQAALDMLK